MAQLIHLNGAPGVGKSSLAGRYLDDHPLALLVDIDAIRSALGCWERIEESRLVARTLAVAMAERHLGDGRDVIIPQYLGRLDFVATLRDLARRSDASFAEVVLEAPVAVAVDRFRRRRMELSGRGGSHPQADVPDEAIESAVEEASARVLSLAAERGAVVLVDATQSIEDTYAELTAALGGSRR